MANETVQFVAGFVGATAPTDVSLHHVGSTCKAIAQARNPDLLGANAEEQAQVGTHAAAAW